MELLNKSDQILAAAKACFIQLGYKATSVETISKFAGIGKGTIYNYFKTKEELLEAIVDVEKQNLILYADSLMQRSSMEENTFLEYLKTSLHYVKNGDLFSKLAFEVQTNGTIEAINSLKSMQDTAFRKLKEMVQLYLEQKKFDGYDSELTTFLMLELYSSLVFKWPEHHQPLTDEQIQELFIKLYPLV